MITVSGPVAIQSFFSHPTTSGMVKRPLMPVFLLVPMVPFTAVGDDAVHHRHPEDEQHECDQVQKGDDHILHLLVSIVFPLSDWGRKNRFPAMVSSATLPRHSAIFCFAIAGFID